MEFSETLKEHFKTRNVNVILFPDKTKRAFETLEAFYEFIQKEIQFWAECNKGSAQSIKTHFDSMFNNLTNAIKVADPNQAKNYLNQAISSSTINSWPCIYSITPVGKFIKERFVENYMQADAAILYLIQGNVNGMGSKEYFKGLMYSFILSDSKTEIAASAEEETLLDLRQRYSSELNELHTSFVDKSERLVKDYETFQQSVTDWKDETQSKADEFIKNKQQQLNDLEKLYQEKLRLEGPASYWKSLSTEYQESGAKWKSWAIWSTTVFIVYLSLILYNLPEIWLKSSGVTLSAIKSTIVFGLITSIGVYIISLFVKLSTSSYHLSRDANERHQLTHLYLSLLEAKGVSENERAIILQSLFSRADTGLLKGDSGPAIPDSVVSQLLKGIQK